jgi:acyl-coenzyme A synthetase/AMP-(fatty) acid ligase
MHYINKQTENIQSSFIRVYFRPIGVLYKNIFELFEYRTHAHSDDIFITFYPDDGNKISLTYKELAEQVFKTANLLEANGIGIEDRVAAISHNHINTVIQYFAAWCIEQLLSQSMLMRNLTG